MRIYAFTHLRISILFLSLLLLPGAVSAQELWRLEKFRAVIEVRADGLIEVTETIGAEFLSARHGIYRYVPTQGKDTSGRDYRITARLLSVTRDGANERVDASRSGDNLVWRIGQPDVTMTGAHEYVIRYEVAGAIGRFQDFDELYWNISGEGWDAPLPAVSAIVILPEGVEAAQSACYTGAYGSTAQDCAIVETDDQIGFVSKTAGSPMTIAVGFPKGLIAEPPAASVISANAWKFLPLLLPLMALIAMYLHWRKHGDDPAFGPIVTQYEAPWNLRPAEANVLMRQLSKPDDVAVTIVDLAVRGFLRIEETKTKGLLGTGLGSSKDHILHLEKDYRNDPSVKPFETKLLDDLFGPGNVPPAQVSISSLKARNFHMKAKEFHEEVAKHLTAEGYFDKDPNKARARFVGFGTALFLPVFFLGLNAWTGAIALSGLIVTVFGFAMAKWTMKGHAAAWHLQGFKAFISAVEKHRAPWMETQNMFEKTLPYAMAFGLGTRWAKAFAPLHLAQPSWYQGAAVGAAWSPVDFQKSLNAWSGSMVTASSPPRSSGSGSGGGGFSGGGGGGGGGGSW